MILHVCHKCGNEYRRPDQLVRHYERSHLNGAR